MIPISLHVTTDKLLRAHRIDLGLYVTFVYQPYHTGRSRPLIVLKNHAIKAHFFPQNPGDPCLCCMLGMPEEGGQNI